MKTTSYFICSFLLLGNLLSAQSFKYQAKINTSANTGLYKLEFKPNYQIYSSANYNDIRVFDSANKEIPYVILCEPVLKSSTDFVEYKIKSITDALKYSHIIVENPNKDAISNIAFNFNNSADLRYCRVEGSDDLNKWYSVSDEQALSLIYNQNYTNQYKTIYFPKNNYSYFKLVIYNWSTPTLKINSAGYFKNSIISGKLNVVENKTQISTDNTKKTTTIKLTFPCKQTINQLSFKIVAPRLFLRQAKVYTKYSEVLKNKKEIFHSMDVLSFELNSDKPLLIDLPNTITNELYIDIENNDNQPLQIDSVITKQLAHYLIFDAQANHNYVLKSGDAKLQKPLYDLINFIKQSPQLLPELNIRNFESIKENDAEKQNKTTPFYETSLFMWACLGVAMLAIGFFVVKLMSDMNKKNN